MKSLVRLFGIVRASLLACVMLHCGQQGICCGMRRPSLACFGMLNLSAAQAEYCALAANTDKEPPGGSCLSHQQYST